MPYILLQLVQWLSGQKLIPNLKGLDRLKVRLGDG
jgi:hypothetical protein